jgi:3'(2'), 5'-bisphosphate nucleotidase
MTPEKNALLDTARAAALAAGSAIMEIYAEPCAVEHKADASPVTEADHRAEAIIVERLRRAAPDIAVVAEELAAAGHLPATAPARFWLVDPLDGTKEFIAGRDEYTVNLALISGRRPIAGFVAAPGRGLLWRGIVGHGAERLAIEGETVGAPQRIQVRQWPMAGAVALVSRSHRDAATEALLERLPPTRPESCGSSLKFCRLAEGAADIYPRLGPTNEWDIAAGHAVVVAAGGIVTEPDGGPLTYGHAERKFLVPAFIAWGDALKARLT